MKGLFLKMLNSVRLVVQKSRYVSDEVLFSEASLFAYMQLQEISFLPFPRRSEAVVLKPSCIFWFVDSATLYTGFLKIKGGND